MAEPIDPQSLIDAELRRLADDIAKRLLDGEVIKDAPINHGEVSLRNCIILCSNLELDNDLQKYFNQEITRSDLCDAIAHELAPLVYESRKPEAADLFIDEYEAIEKAFKDW